jgi:uncharacterized protein YlxW (UPF0749 family)
MTDRHDPDQPAPDRPTSDRPTSDRPASDRPASERPTSDRPASERPTSDRPASERPAADVPPFEMPTAGRPPAPVSGAGAGPAPGAAAEPGDEPTVVSGPGEETRPAAAKRTKPYLRGADDDKTRLLRPPAPAAEIDGGETRVLRPPAKAAAPAGAAPAGAAPAGADGAGADAETAPDDEPTVERDRPAASGADEPDERLRSVAQEWLSARARDRDGPGDPAGERDTDELAPPAASAAPEPGGADSTGLSTERVSSVRGVDDPGAVGSGDALVPDEAKDADAEPAAASVSPDSAGEPPAGTGKAGRKKLTSAGALIWVLLALLGYTLVVQLRSNDDDQGLASARQEDLVSILSDLESRDSRLQSEITSLESSQRQLTSGVSSRQAALAEAEKRADELGLLAGTLPGKGPGLKIVIDKVKASAILNAVEELRGAGGEVMELAGADGTAVRIVASSYFVDAQGGGIDADGTRLDGPWTLWVIGSPQTMQTALQIPGGVVASVQGAGGSVTMEPQTMVEVTAVRKASTLQYAHPAS